MTDAASVFSIVHAITAITGMLLNAFLTYLALFKTPRVIKSYATLIVNFAITDFFACLFDFFVQQRIIPSGLSLGYVSNGLCRHFGPTTCYVGYSVMLHGLSHSLWSLLLSFSYRCYILFKPAPTRVLLVLIIGLAYTPSLFQCISLLFAQDEPAEIRRILQEAFPSYNLTGHTVSGTKNILCFSCLFAVFHMSLPVIPIYICILILRRTIISRLNFQGVNITKDTKNMHAQLLMALTYQAALPGVYLFSVASYVIGQLGIFHHPALEYFTFSSFLLIPFLSPFASFLFVTPYRQFITSTFHKVARIEPVKITSTHPTYTIHSHVVE